MSNWQDFMRNEIRQLVNSHARQNGMPHREVWHVLYDRFADQGGIVPDTKNKLQAFEEESLERLLTVAKTI